MRILLITLIAGSLLFLSSCSNSSEETEIDCSQSDLAIDVMDSTSPECDVEGSITVIGSGGTTPYSYSIDGVNFQSSATFSNLAAGNYTLTIMDANDCSDDTTFELSTGASGITIDATIGDSDCLDDTGSITVNATGGSGTFMYSLDEGTSQNENSFTGVGAGTHVVTVTDDDGCSATREVLITTGTSWATDIMPIIDAKCAVSGCHNGDNGSDRNWSILSNVQTNASNIKSRTGNGSMPPAGSTDLTQDEIDLIACWVDDGANNN